MKLILQGKTFESVRIDYTLSLRTSDEYEVQTGRGLILSSSYGDRTVTPHPDTADSSAKALEGIMREKIIAAEAEESGALSLEFANHVRLGIEPDEDYEAWDLSGPDGVMLVCMPGGELAEYPANEEC